MYASFPYFHHVLIRDSMATSEYLYNVSVQLTEFNFGVLRIFEAWTHLNGCCIRVERIHVGHAYVHLACPIFFFYYYFIWIREEHTLDTRVRYLDTF